LSYDIQAINEKVKSGSSFVDEIFEEMSKAIVGQKYMVERLLIGLLSGGHILLEGVPGLAKTTAIKTLSSIIETDFQRIQFTPDLLPADILGTIIYDNKTGDFIPKKGPLFSNLILADEINRAPAKVQSALLEAMQEKQITLGSETFYLDEPFLVLATQNPIEQEGTYPLPEAQVDRFMLKIKITYPTREEELSILNSTLTKRFEEPRAILTPEKIAEARKLVDEVYVDEKIKQYIINIVFATRNPQMYDLNISDLIEYGASPRATIYLCAAAKAHAFIRRRGYVTPEDVKAIGLDVLRHRVIVTYEAEAEEMTSEDVVRKIFDQVEVP